MKKLLLTSAIAVLSVGVAQAAPTVYGKAFLSLDGAKVDTDVTTNGVKQSTSANERTQLKSNGSRIGFKGSESLSENTDLMYQLEYRVEVDGDFHTERVATDKKDDKGETVYTNASRTRSFEPRDTYVGLANKQFGTVKVGRLSTIDGEVDYANVAKGGVYGGDGIIGYDGHRTNNAVSYETPNYNGLSFLGMYVMKEDRANTLDREAFVAAVKYEPEDFPVKVGGAYTKIGAQNVMRVSGAYQVTDNLGFGALYQNTQYIKGGDRENTLAVSGTFSTSTPWAFYTQLDSANNVGGAKDTKAQRIVLGSTYAFNKATTAHLYGALSKGTVTTADVKTETIGMGLGAGLEYKF